MHVIQSQIKHLLVAGEFNAALLELRRLDPSSWSDTMTLRCLRALHLGDIAGNAAIDTATRLFAALNQRNTPYTLTRSERNNQLRDIALIFSEHGNAEQACEIMRSLCKQNPQMSELHSEYAFALGTNLQLDQAEAELNKALELQPSNANCHAQLARIYCHTGRVAAGYNSYSLAATIDPNNPNYLQRLIYWSNYLEGTSRQSNYQLSRLWASKAHPGNKVGTNTWRTANPERQLKIAFVSSRFSSNAISCFLTPLLDGINRQHFHVTVYNNTRKVNTTSQALRQRCDAWRDTQRDSDKQLSGKISADQIDILVDLDGHGDNNRLGVFANHAAPIQLGWLGHRATTGLNSVDYRLSDQIADPAGMSDQFYTEQLLRLPSGLLCYAAPENAPPIPSSNFLNSSVADPASNGESTTRFGSFNRLAKISSITLDCWAAAMHAVPNSTLCLKRQELTNRNARDFITREFSERGIGSPRLIYQHSYVGLEQHLSEYNSIDIALDTSPYNGVTTTLEALWMGVPVVSLKGRTHASRLSASVLEQLDLEGLATRDASEFAERARELAELKTLRRELRTGLRSKMRRSPLMNSAQFCKEFDVVLRGRWRAWCEQNNSGRDSHEGKIASSAGSSR